MSDQIVDACCLINLYASGQIQAMIPACGGSFHLSEQVQRESLMIRQVDPADASLLIPFSIVSNGFASWLKLKAIRPGCDLPGYGISGWLTLWRTHPRALPAANQSQVRSIAASQ